MDIYNLINSKAISEHCRKISHQFSPLEMAYLVYANDSLNIVQKHSAFNEIIKEQPDTAVVERPWTPHFESLHRFLQNYMELQNKYLSIFYKDEPNCVYSFKVWYSGDDDYCEDDRLFLSFSACYKAIKNDIDELIAHYKESDMDIYPIEIKVKKQWLNNDENDQAKYMSVCIDYNNVPVDIWDTHSIISSEDSDILCAFEGLWVEIPTPFKKGDILTSRCKRKRDEEPFVLDWIPYWEEDERCTKIVAHLRESGDSSDLITSIYGQDKDGATWHDHGPSYLDMEYYEKELCGTEKFLLAVSNHVKGELPLELLIRSYDILKTERHAKEERRLISGFYGELLQKAGLSERDNAEITNDEDD